MTDEIRFDTYYRYDILTRFLQAWAAQYPALCRLESIGQSFEGREIWIMTVTNQATGPAEDKPALWVDANIHATEVSPSSAALYLLHRLLTTYGADPRVTYALDSRAFYVVPRVNPDGAEWALADRPRFIRSSTRPYPREEQLDGLIREDIDGDGRILQMRLKDPQGAWKPHPDHPRLLVRREPDDLPGGDYFRLLPEGRVQNYDGALIKSAPSLQGLDLNRQFPVSWTPAQTGAGDFPGSEPETRALLQFVSDHPNITGSISLHTFSGVHLRPLTRAPDTEMPTADLATYRAIGRKATELTGYPAISVHHDFAYDPKDFIKGTFDDWMFEVKGVYAWTTEIWSPQQQAGLKDYRYFDWLKDHPVEDDVRIYEWLQEATDGEAYADWTPFEHPQLGPVDLGGWNGFLAWTNPPPSLLEKEIAPLSDFMIYSALIAPKLELYRLDVTSQGDVHAIRLVLHNTGWLPTHVTETALKMKAVEPLEVNLSLPAGARLIAGETRTELGQLKGRDHTWAFSGWSSGATDERAKVEWVVQAPAGSEIAIVAKHPRAGTVRTKAVL